MGLATKAAVAGVIAAGLYCGSDIYAASKRTSAHQTTAARRGAKRTAVPSLERRMQETITTPAGSFVLDHQYELPCTTGARKGTKLIVYHESQGHYQAKNAKGETVLGGDIPTLRGERFANFYVDQQGVVHAIVPEGCVSYGSGVSAYNGLEQTVTKKRGKQLIRYQSVDPVAINIEDEHSPEDMADGIPLPEKQYSALRVLLSYLRDKYRVPDERVVPHATVAANPRMVDGERVWRRNRRVDGLTEDRSKLGLSGDWTDEYHDSGKAVYSKMYERALEASKRQPETHWYDGVMSTYNNVKSRVGSRLEPAKAPRGQGAAKYAPAARRNANDGPRHDGTPLSMLKSTVLVAYDGISEKLGDYVSRH